MTAHPATTEDRMTDTDPARALLADILAIVNRHQGLNAEQAMAEIGAACLASIDRPAAAAARHEPRVWLPGDLVPAGAWVVDSVGAVDLIDHEVPAPTTLVEVHVPDFAAEQARRAATDGEVTE